MSKTRYHDIPKSYLKFFCDNSWRVLVYRKDDPCKTIALSPDNVAFHKYYYSHPRQDGGRDHNAFQDCFSIEGFYEVFDRIGICALHNKTDVPFL